MREMMGVLGLGSRRAPPDQKRDRAVLWVLCGGLAAVALGLHRPLIALALLATAVGELQVHFWHTPGIALGL